ncbi:MAG: hypothetical protein MI864_12065 [Pseudomonadales bacterium]|nr:hypothetical protein [Pseudomonadales bacterium]
MEEFDFSAWKVNLQASTVTHESGFSIQFEGKPGRNFNGSPRNWPEGLGALEKARLLRFGYEAFRQAVQSLDDKRAKRAKSMALQRD